MGDVIGQGERHSILVKIEMKTLKYSEGTERNLRV
jgi:hypothetical protein